MKFTNIFRAIGFAIFIFILSSCKKDKNPEITGTGKVNLEFDHVVGTQALQLGTQSYTNANGDDFKVDVFKYYVSNIVLNKADGSKYIIPESYLLIDAADAVSKLQTLENIPAGDYTGMDFIIGVDEARNFAGAQTGALDPNKGMFWTWNSGYVFVKFEGSSSKSTQTNNKLVFHVGGAKAPNNAIRATHVDFPVILRIRNNSEPDVHLMVDVASLFKGKTIISFAATSGFMGGPNSVIMAENYVTGLFRVDHIHN